MPNPRAHLPRRALGASVALLILIGAPRIPRADPLARFGLYEKNAIRTALHDRGLELDPEPQGKRLGVIHVDTLPVFPDSAGALQVFNLLHRTTRGDIIARELLIHPGDLWSPSLVRESERNIRDGFVINLTVIVPVKSVHPGHVDALVVTRDVWSLRTNSEFENQAGTFTFLSIQLAENNLLGWRKQVAMVFEMDLGKYSIGPRYFDPNIRGTRLQLLLRPEILFSRETGEAEGTRSQTVLEYPLWSLARKWAGLASLVHENAVERVFQGDDLATYDNPDTTEVEALPREYRQKRVEVRIEATRSLGTWLKHHFTFGHELASIRPRLRERFPGDAADAEAFTRDVLPRSELISAVVGRYRIFTPRFITYRDINTFDLPEYEQVGPDATLELALAGQALGSTSNFLRYSASLGWTFDLGGQAYSRVKLGASGRWNGDTVIDRELDASVFASSPPLWDSLRVVGAVETATQDNVEDNKLFIVGGQTGVRGYEVGAFTGTSFARANLEVRTLPVPISFIRLGGLAFFDTGDAGTSLSALSPYSDFGIGLRLLAPQTAKELYRLDWAIATRGPNRGLPGRISFGFEQAF